MVVVVAAVVVAAVNAGSPPKFCRSTVATPNRLGFLFLSTALHAGWSWLETGGAKCKQMFGFLPLHSFAQWLEVCMARLNHCNVLCHFSHSGVDDMSAAWWCLGGWMDTGDGYGWMLGPARI